MKHPIFFLLALLLFLTLACSVVSGAPVPADAPPLIVEVTPTTSPFAAEEANAGAHHYWMSPNENGCEASDGVKVAQFRDKEMSFAPDFSTVTYGDRTYPRVGDHRYQSINQNDKPLVLIFSEHGYVLHVYNPGDDPNNVGSCLTFSFTLAD